MLKEKEKSYWKITPFRHYISILFSQFASVYCGWSPDLINEAFKINFHIHFRNFYDSTALFYVGYRIKYNLSREIGANFVFSAHYLLS